MPEKTTINVIFNGLQMKTGAIYPTFGTSSNQHFLRAFKVLFQVV